MSKVAGWAHFQNAINNAADAQQDAIQGKAKDIDLLVSSLMVLQQLTAGAYDACQEMHDRIERLHQKIDRMEKKLGTVR